MGRQTRSMCNKHMLVLFSGIMVNISETKTVPVFSFHHYKMYVFLPKYLKCPQISCEKSGHLTLHKNSFYQNCISLQNTEGFKIDHDVHGGTLPKFNRYWIQLWEKKS